MLGRHLGVLPDLPERIQALEYHSLFRIAAFPVSSGSPIRGNPPRCGLAGPQPSSGNSCPS
jgi:hypothetical protein